jgi:hypothetical protein
MGIIRAMGSQMTNETKDVSIEILVGAESDKEGEKSIFDTAARVIAPIRTNTSHVTQSLSEFCQAFAAGIEGAANALTKYELQTVEMKVELNTKGEVRLIASGSAELKGGIKLVFHRKP